MNEDDVIARSSISPKLQAGETTSQSSRSYVSASLNLVGRRPWQDQKALPSGKKPIARSKQGLLNNSQRNALVYKCHLI